MLVFGFREFRVYRVITKKDLSLCFGGFRVLRAITEKDL